MKTPMWVSKSVWLFTLFWLAGWFIKAAFFIPYFYKISFAYPAANDFFPSFLQSNVVSGIFYILPALCFFNLLTDNIVWHRLNCMVMVVSSAVLCLHQNTYNDATFVSSFWTALWLLWLTFSFARADNVEKHAIILGHWVIGLMFLGGLVGKLTPEYFSGEAFRHIFVDSGGLNPLNQILSALRVTNAQAAYRVISLAVIATEAVLALNIFVHTRAMRLLSLVCLPLLTLFSTWRILSVVGALAGVLLAVGGIDGRTRKAATP